MLPAGAGVGQPAPRTLPKEIETIVNLCQCRPCEEQVTYAYRLQVVIQAMVDHHILDTDARRSYQVLKATTCRHRSIPRIFYHTKNAVASFKVCILNKSHYKIHCNREKT